MNIAIVWSDEPIKCLGIWFSNNQDQRLISYNWEHKLNLMENKIAVWKKRNLSLFGKVLIIKSVLLSNIILQASVLPIPQGIEKKLNNLIFGFLWNGHDKLKRTSVIRDVEQGGLNITVY